jgi:orotate phosphoribosyltransferase-like protein
MADMVRKGRDGNRRLSEADVLEARALRTEGWTFQAIADRLGVSRAGAFYAVKGATWQHVKGATA